MENTTENKARFFALYINQRAYRRNNVNYDNDILATEPLHGDIFAPDATFFMREGHLHLRSIESLTDEEKEKLCIISYMATTGSPPSGEGTFDHERHVKTGEWLASDVKLIPLAATDYLRSICVLIPFMGLSVEEIIDYGWAKLTPAAAI